MKKALKIVGIIIGLLLVLIILAPILFKGPIEKAVKNSINKSINATVEWEELDLSLISSFPNAELKLKNLSVINKAPFKNDTLATSEELGLSLGIPQLFKGGPYSINELTLNNAYVNIKVDSLGNANYDIAKETTTDTTTTQANNAGNALSLDIQHYEVNNSRINYLDESSKTFLRITNFNHYGNGDFTAEKTNLETKTEAIVSFELDSVNYLNKNNLKLDANFEMDLANQKYTFLENKALINQLPLTFDGFVKINENNQEIDLTFKTPSSDFKNFLAVIPETYSKNLDGVETTGDFTVNGEIKGIVDEKHIPTMNIAIKSDNASFKYPDLPKKVEDISIDAVLKNKTGILEDTYVNLEKLNFKIDQDRFTAKGNFKNLMDNPLINLTANGTLNLANLEKAYPLELDMDLNGILNANLTANFDMNSIEKEQYQNVKSSGHASISNFKYSSPEIPNEVNIAKASLNFNNAKVTLEEMDIKSGQTDAKITGTLDNFMGYLFSDQVLKGRFKVQSNTFSVNDFMVAETKENQPLENNKDKTSTPTKEDAIKIPSFLDAKLDFSANTVIYDNLTLKNTKGALSIKDETASLENVSADIFGGNIGINGNVSTKTETPVFDMQLSLNRIDIVESFQKLELIQNIAPLANALQGLLTTKIKLNGNLTNELTPILTSLAGSAFAEVLNAKVNTEKTPLLSKLNGELNFLNLNKLVLKDLSTNLTFNNGQIQVDPFNFNIEDINITAGGSHSFDNQMNYSLKLDIPAKYLGDKIGSGLANLTKTDIQSTKVELPIGLSGTFASPKIQLNMKQAVSDLTQQIVEKQKDELKDKAKEEVGKKLKDLLGGKGKENAKDSTATKENKSDEDKIKEAAGDILNGLFGKKKKK
ncbi:AsmA-like C-terminal region-containing protein [Mesonia aestuariivivens]|uniref:AsmA family protein n=1 Tax=Mesonia aestuariivivens TaxID=2796128 RepID=A0ABS6W5E7_9FLAO|nr:AsmA-like C-terminal region-containing protein [Mesonia aestuariivivens]MBW2962339.1 AsmA family protein [Mesonia aestuariivivens]